MANFGFSRLTVVAPYEPHWQEAKSAIGAEDLLQNTRRTETLAEAVAECTLVIGTGTLTYRKPEEPVVALPDLVAFIESKGARGTAPGGRIALVFGPEKHGLTREDLSHCHVLVEIPTDPAQPSMNLGQAVAVCLYELATRLFSSDVEPTTLDPDVPPFPQRKTERMGHGAPVTDLARTYDAAATASRQELLAGLVEELMVASDYSPAAMREANRHDLRLLLRRLTLTDKDTRRILGLLRRVLWKLRN